MLRSRSEVRRGMGFALALAAATSLLIGAAPAPTDGDSVADDAPVVDRVIDRTDEQLPVLDMGAQSRARGIVDVQGVIPLPDGVTLSVGEKVQINYSNGVAVHEAVTASCSTSATAANPVKSGNQATASHTVSHSSGCSGNLSVNGGLESYAWPNWHRRDYYLSTVASGGTRYMFTAKACVNSGSTLWRSKTGTIAAVLAQSPEVSLACNPG